MGARILGAAVTVAESYDDARLVEELDVHGCVRIPELLAIDECRSLANSYESSALFRSRVVMAQHGFGLGEYRYFAYPLPQPVAQLRQVLYPSLALIANHWNELLGIEQRYPLEHAAYLERCRAQGQDKPTPLLLKYRSGDYNCLHQDLYGAEVFPLQLTILLSDPQRDFTGGEFVLTEQRPRRQSRVEVVALRQGEGVIFPVRHRPIRGAQRISRATLRHGVSRLRSGERYTLGIIFHDAH
jgi:uncharacterized protein